MAGPLFSPAQGRRVGVMAAGFGTFINLYTTQAILVVLARDFGVSFARTGLTVTAPLAAVALVAPFVGSISDRLGRKRLIVGAGFLLALPTLLIAGIGDFSLLIALRFAQGLLLPFIFAITIAYIGDETSEAENIRLAGSYSIGTIIGGFCGRLIAGYAAALIGWRAGFVILALLTAGAALIVALVLPRERQFRPQHGLRAALEGFALHIANPRLIATYAAGFAVLFSIVATFTYVNFLLAAPPYSLGPAALGNIFATYLVAIVSTPLATRLAVRMGRRVTLLVAATTGIAGLTLTLIGPLPAIVAGLALGVGGMFLEQVMAIGFVAQAAERAKSTAVGLYVTFYYIGGALGGILPGSLWRGFGWPGCVGLIIVVQLIMLAIALPFWRPPASH
uniref:MFS transporter n=1 Tax=Acidicaldus sp. TaxID=1872105 RepID=A0A8J4HDQ5_9PROT